MEPGGSLAPILMNGLPKKQGLYDPAFEKDACGVAFVADIQGRANRIRSSARA